MQHNLTGPEVLQDIQNSLKILLSESHKQQQDLYYEVKDVLGALKFGFALLQHATTEQGADLENVQFKIMSALREQEDKIDDLQESVDEDQLDEIQTTVEA